MRQSILFGIGMLFLAGCQTGSNSTSNISHTLAGNPIIPVKDLRNCFGENGWKSIKDLPYDGYVILRGFINTDHSVEIDRLVEAYPDDSRNSMAYTFAEEVRLTPTRIGSNVKPHARVYIVFYENPPLPGKALIFAEQYGVASTVTLGQQIYLRNEMYPIK